MHLLFTGVVNNYVLNKLVQCKFTYFIVFVDFFDFFYMYHIFTDFFTLSFYKLNIEIHFNSRIAHV